VELEGKALNCHLKVGRLGEMSHFRVFMKDMVSALHQGTANNISHFLSGLDPPTNQPRVFAGNANKVTQLHRTGHAMRIVTFESGKLVSIF
jgi:hypothetical protein